MKLARGQFLQIRQRPVEDIAVASIGISVCVLPDGLEGPAAGDGAGGAAVAGEDEGGLCCGWMSWLRG